VAPYGPQSQGTERAETTPCRPASVCQAPGKTGGHRLDQLFADSGSMICGISVMVVTGIPLSSAWRKISASLSAR
jgi:hypothetical protein